MKNEFQQIEHDSVVRIIPIMFKVSDLLSAIVTIFQVKGLDLLRDRLNAEGRGLLPAVNNSSIWFNDGVSCEILKPGKTWQKGKVRIKITLEFCPNEPEIPETPAKNQLEIGQPESPLADLRKIIDQGN